MIRPIPELSDPDRQADSEDALVELTLERAGSTKRATVPRWLCERYLRMAETVVASYRLALLAERTIHTARWMDWWGGWACAVGGALCAQRLWWMGAVALALGLGLTSRVVWMPWLLARRERSQQGE